MVSSQKYTSMSTCSDFTWGLICHGIVPSTTFCYTLFGCEIASASLVQPIIIVYLPAVATTIFTPKPAPNNAFGQITLQKSLHIFTSTVFCSQIGLYLRIPEIMYRIPLSPAKGTKVPCTDGSAKAGKSQGVCKGTWQLRFIQPLQRPKPL